MNKGAIAHVGRQLGINQETPGREEVGPCRSIRCDQNIHSGSGIEVDLVIASIYVRNPFVIPGGDLAERVQTFQPGELPLVILAILERAPMNRYELMGELNRLFAPAYRASPGGVYPAVAALHEQGLISLDPAQRRRRFALTDIGISALEERRDRLSTIEVRESVRLGPDGTLEPVLERFVARLLPLSGRVDPSSVERLLTVVAGKVEDMDEEVPDE